MSKDIRANEPDTSMWGEAINWKIERRTNSRDEIETYINQGYTQIAEVNSIEDLLNKGRISSLLVNSPKLLDTLKSAVCLIVDSPNYKTESVKMFVKECNELINEIEK